MNSNQSEPANSLEEMMMPLEGNDDPEPEPVPGPESREKKSTAIADSAAPPQQEEAPRSESSTHSASGAPSGDATCSNANAALQPDLMMANCHLTYLDPNAKGYFFMAIKDKTYTKSWVNQDLNAVKNDLIRYNQQGYGIYVAVNEIDHSGRRKQENVTRIRAVFEDNDTPHAVPPVYPLQPSFEVESSPGKFHRYWVLNDAMTKADFAEVTKTLIRTCHSDPACKDPNRVLRLAGFYHPALLR